MNWRDEKRTRRHKFVTRRDEDFVQEFTPSFPAPRGLIRYCTRVLRFRAGSNFAKKNKRLLAVYHLNKLKAMSEIFIRK